MAKDFQDTVRQILSQAVDAKSLGAERAGNSNGGLSGIRGLAFGAGAAALAPVAAKGVGKLAKVVAMDGINGLVRAPANAVEDVTSKVGDSVGDVTSRLGDSVGSSIGGKLTEKVEESGGPGGLLKEAVKGMLPFGGGGDGGGKGGSRGVGKGRRMPVQQGVYVGVPIETAYNQWTQFELWPNFMHRVTRVTQQDDCTVSFATKIWGKTKEFTAQIITQRPDERVKWRVTQGMTHTGVVTFHEVGPSLTRIELGLDVEPGGLLEKAARGMRHVKRAARGDLHRFKAFIEMEERETGAWRGRIEAGKLVEKHDPSYDKQRDYADPEAVVGDQEKDDQDAGNGRRAAPQRRTSSAKRATSRGSSNAGRGSASGSRNGSPAKRSTSSRSQASGARSNGRSGSSNSRSRGRSGSSSGSSGARSGSAQRTRSTRRS